MSSVYIHSAINSKFLFYQKDWGKAFREFLGRRDLWMMGVEFT